MDLEKKLQLIREVGEEIVTEPELKELLETKSKPVAYDGFEPSGKIHIAQGILRVININKMIKAGFRFKMLIADWHAWANNKMGGDLEKIRKVGEYLLEVWKVTGMDLNKVEFLWVSDYTQDDEYWKKVMQIARSSTVRRIIRCGQIMGRKDSEVLQASQIIYPCMQAADIFHLQVDVCQLGTDQRKVNMLAREIGPKLGFWKPVIVSHHMIMGLRQPQTQATGLERTIEMKMSKSIPDSAIFMTDSREEIERKIQKAYCPEKQIQDNPVMEYMKYIIFEKFDSIEIPRPEKFGGPLEMQSCQELEKLYQEGKIHPLDLKSAAVEYLDRLIEPVRKHFETNPKARKLKEFLDSQEITR